MASVTWDEIRSLRADFLNLQLTEAANKLAERNCVELIGLLTKEGLLHVIHTTDGKDIITDQRLIREMLDEIYGNGGRINIVDLAQHLRVDLSYIESKVGDVCKEDPTLQFTLGQFISAEYTARLVEEINDLLTERGSIPISDLIRQFDLPTDYLQSMINTRLVGSSMNGIKLDSGTLYTENYVRLQQNILCGYLQASLLPVRVSEIIKTARVNENLVQNLILNLIRDHRINGNLIGTTKENSIFYPKVYTDAQSKYIESFFTQNGYLEYSLVKNVGIADPEGQSKMVLKDRRDILFLISGCIDLAKFLPQLEMNIEQGLLSNEFVDLMSLLPTSFAEKDLEKLLKSELSIQESIQTAGGQLFSDSFVISKDILGKIDRKLQEMCADCATKEAAQCTPQMYAAALNGTIVLSSGKSSSATSKKPTGNAGKRKGASKVQEEPVTGQETISFVGRDEIKSQIRSINEDLPDEVLDLLTENLYSSKSRQFLEMFTQRVKESFASKESEGATENSRKNEIKHAQDAIRQIHGNICIFSRSIEQLITENQSALVEALQRHLIRSLCSELFDLLIREVEPSVANKTAAMTIEERNKVLQKIPETSRNILVKVNEQLNGKDVEITLTRLEDAAKDLIGIPLKRPNKKAEKDLVVEIREKLKTKLTEEKDPAMILHLTVTLLFYSCCAGRLVHAPGKTVPTLINYLSKQVPTEIHRRLVEMQNFIIQQSNSAVSTGLFENEKIDFIRNLGLQAKENMSFSSFVNEN